MSEVSVASLTAAQNTLPAQAIFYSDGCESHLDLGSNDGRTFRGMDRSRITCVEAFGPSVEKLRQRGFKDVWEDDIRNAVATLAREVAEYQADLSLPAEKLSPVIPRRPLTFDRVTAFDVIEHIPKADGERLLDQLESIATREIILFLPIETPELEATETWREFREHGLSLHPNAQRELHDHKSRWAPEELQARGYLTMVLQDFHYPGFSAFFAAKYKRAEDRDAAIRRCQAFAASTSGQVQGWAYIGQGSRVNQPLFVAGAEHMSIGEGVSIGYGARLECVTSYGGQEYHPSLSIGDGTTAEFFLHIGCAGRVSIGRDCVLAGHISITDHQHGYATDRPLHGQPLTVKPVEIGDSTFIGEYTMILPGVHIGHHCVIGAHSVVTHDVEPYDVVGGVPAASLWHGPTVLQHHTWSEHRPLVSIVIPTVDATSDRLALCRASIAARTIEDGETIVVEDKERRGFAWACNQGIARALAHGADYICLLNDDTMPAWGWLARMLAVMRAYPDVGLVGPTSDSVSGPQCVPPPAGWTGEAWGIALADQRAGISQEVSRLVGFCLLIRREVVEKVGGLDTSLLNAFEDDDLCLRARAAGWHCRIALDSFVHHAGQQTFKAEGLDYNATLMAGWAAFAAKWQARAVGPASYSVQVPEFSEATCYVPLPEGVPA